MTPEHPGWRPWWIRYAEYEGRAVVLCDGFSPTMKSPTISRYTIWYTEGPRPWGVPPSTQLKWSLAEAEAAFEQAAQQLVGGA